MGSIIKTRRNEQQRIKKVWTKGTLHFVHAFYCIGKIDFFFEISVFLTIFSYTTRLGFLGQCIFAKQNAHVCVESSAFANAHLSYCIGKIDFFLDITVFSAIFPIQQG